MVKDLSPEALPTRATWLPHCHALIRPSTRPQRAQDAIRDFVNEKRIGMEKRERLGAEYESEEEEEQTLATADRHGVKVTCWSLITCCFGVTCWKYSC